jgi:hypothetical protein
MGAAEDIHELRAVIAMHDVVYGDRIKELESVIREILSQIDQGGSGGKVFARDYCIERARTVLGNKA